MSSGSAGVANAMTPLCYARILVFVLALLPGCYQSREREAETMLGINTEIEIGECNLISALTVVPLEVVLGGEISVAASANAGAEHRHWYASAGSFDDPAAASTIYRCSQIGTQALTFEVADGAWCKDSALVEVTCSPSPLCGDGELDPGESCDDANHADGDGCSATCKLELARGPD